MEVVVFGKRNAKKEKAQCKLLGVPSTFCRHCMLLKFLLKLILLQFYA